LQGAISRDGESIAFEISFYHPARWTLGVARSDGSALQEYPDVASPSSICWSNDKSKLALNAAVPKQPNGAILILRLNSNATRQVDLGGSLTSQCWSPDDKKIVYGLGESIRIYDLGEMKWMELAKGEDPAWSPDGKWIAFYHDAAYYAIRPSGADQKVLFRKKGHSGGPWWSPDSELVAYMSLSGKTGNWMGFDSRQLRVRRLADSSDDWVLNEPDASFSPEYQWVLPRQTASH
jgi:Tol biopolymer transport system component